MTTFSQDYKELLASVAKKAALPDTALPDATEALKALTPYAIALLKQSKDKGEDSDVPSFLDFQADMKATTEAQNGTAAIPGRRGRNGPRLLGGPHDLLSD